MYLVTRDGALGTVGCHAGSVVERGFVPTAELWYIDIKVRSEGRLVDAKTKRKDKKDRQKKSLLWPVHTACSHSL